jgi:hypothetical protein
MDRPAELRHIGRIEIEGCGRRGRLAGQHHLGRLAAAELQDERGGELQAGRTEPGSTPRAKRYWASDVSPASRPVRAVAIGANQALSRKTSVVVSSQPVLAPPMTPPRPDGPPPMPSAITHMAGVRS